MPTCIVMVGLPALGKSTRVNDIRVMNPDVFVYSTDQYIESVASAKAKTYDEVFLDTIREATENMDNFLQYAIEDHRDVVWDQTNLGIGKRRKIINRMKQAGYSVECECFVIPRTDTGVQEWIKRLASRTGKTIPDRVMNSMLDNYIKPDINEGFDAVTYRDMYGNIIT